MEGGGYETLTSLNAAISCYAVKMTNICNVTLTLLIYITINKVILTFSTTRGYLSSLVRSAWSLITSLLTPVMAFNVGSLG